MLLINKKYRGRLHEEAVKLVKKGVRVGMMWLSGESIVHCHVCNKDFNAPELHPVHNDLLGECPHCQTTFVFAKA